MFGPEFFAAARQIGKAWALNGDPVHMAGIVDTSMQIHGVGAAQLADLIGEAARLPLERRPRQVIAGEGAEIVRALFNMRAAA